jgi:hypothetical protein
MGADGDNQTIDDVQCLNKNVQVTVGHRIERARIKSGRHESPFFGFARLLSWKPAYRKRGSKDQRSRFNPVPAILSR